MNKKNINSVFIVLGAVWLIVGFIIYPTSSIWTLGLIFLIVGFVGRFAKKTEQIIS
jgi:membrane-bound ClpP family serine protease